MVIADVLRPRLATTHEPKELYNRSPRLGVLVSLAYLQAPSSFSGLPYRILNINHKKELLRDLWVQSGVLLLMIMMNLHYLKGPKLWQLWSIPYHG